MFWNINRDTPYLWRDQVQLAAIIGHQRGLQAASRGRGVRRRGLQNGLTVRLVVTSTVLRIVAEQALKGYGAEEELSKTVLCLGAELPTRLRCIEEDDTIMRGKPRDEPGNAAFEAVRIADVVINMIVS